MGVETVSSNVTKIGRRGQGRLGLALGAGPKSREHKHKNRSSLGTDLAATMLPVAQPGTLPLSTTAAQDA